MCGWQCTDRLGPHYQKMERAIISGGHRKNRCAQAKSEMWYQDVD